MKKFWTQNVLWERSPAVCRPQNLRTGLRECWMLEKTLILSATASTAISRPTPFLNNSARSTQQWNRERWSKRPVEKQHRLVYWVIVVDLNNPKPCTWVKTELFSDHYMEISLFSNLFDTAYNLFLWTNKHSKFCLAPQNVHISRPLFCCSVCMTCLTRANGKNVR